MLLDDWRVLLAGRSGLHLRPGATPSRIDRAETQLGACFPAQLRRLYEVSDGVFDQPGQWWVVWPVAEAVRRTESAWSDAGAGRRQLVSFGDDGTGATFCVPRDGGAGVFVWHPVEAAPLWLANDVSSFWEAWTAGTLTT